jgi:sigma-B regulation protein RsbU (phosphoserine phosphatase)
MLERLRRAIEQTADMVVITDRGGTIEYANPALEEMTGWSPAEALGKNPRILRSGMHPPEFYERLWRTILRGDVFRDTMVNRRKDGTTYVAQQTITPVRDESGHVTHFVAVSKDMTEHNRLVRREAELDLAAAVQRRMFPRSIPRSPGLDVAGRCVPATETSGDTFDVLARPGGELALVVGDVSGHGVGPALLMSEARAYLRSLAPLPLSPGEILDRIRALIVPDLPDASFVSLLIVQVEPAAGRLRWAGAGHVPGLVVDRNGAVRERLASTGPVLGIVEAARYATREGAVLGPDCLLVLATDGAIECPRPDGSLLEERGLAALVAECFDRSARSIVEELHRRIVQVSLGASDRDDVTLLVAKRLPA